MTRSIRYLAITIIVLAGIGLTAIYIAGSSEYCFKKAKWVSDQEKITAAINFVLEVYPFIASRERLAKTTNSLQPGNNYTPIDYKSLDEFMKLNPDCCKIVRDENYQPNIMETVLFSRSSSLVQVRYKLRYISFDGKSTERQVVERHQFTTCGEHVSVIRETLHK